MPFQQYMDNGTTVPLPGSLILLASGMGAALAFSRKDLFKKEGSLYTPEDMKAP
jgi:hypothetical protein